MEVVGKKTQAQLDRLKKNIRNSHDYFKDNAERFHKWKGYTFNTTVTDDDIMVLQSLNKPQIEFNIMEAYISRLRGEFSKQEPSVNVQTEDGASVDPQIINIVEGHLRHIFHEANKQGCEYNTYTDSLSGGFSVIKVWTDYANPMSFNQVIKFEPIWDATMCGFDPLARLSTKSDGQYCFELFPKTKEEFQREYPNVNIDKLQFTRYIDAFSWSFNNNKQDIIVLADYYEKKKKEVKIIKLSNGKVLQESEYEDFLKEWNETQISQAPRPIGEARKTTIQVIVRYRMIENQILEYTETDYTHLPLVFVDGNSQFLRQGSPRGNFIQMTRPYLYHALGTQRLKNFAGQTLANELENLVQHKFMLAKESIPNEKPFQDGWTNVQLAQTLVFNAFKDNDPDQPVPPPREVQRVPAPPEVMGAFSASDQTMQMILGSFDAALGINDNQLSGIAIQEGATQSNSAAMPYVVGFMEALTQIATIIIDLLPKYYVTPRTIPIVGMDGKASFVEINGENQPSFNYDNNSLNVKVEAGVNFSIQKSKALNQIIAMSQASELFGEFINTVGLEVILDNFEVRGIDQLKILAEQFSEQKAQQQQQQMQMAQQQMMNNPQMIRAQTEQQKIQLETQQAGAELHLKASELAIQKQSVDNDTLKIMNDAKMSGIEAIVAIDKADAEKSRAAVDMAIKAADMSHRHVKEAHELKHMLKQPSREQGNQS